MDSLKGNSNVDFGVNQPTISIAVDFNLSSELSNLINTNDNLSKQATIVLNIEKVLIQKKIRLESITNDDVQKMINHLETVVKAYDKE